MLDALRALGLELLFQCPLQFLLRGAVEAGPPSGRVLRTQDLELSLELGDLRSEAPFGGEGGLLAHRLVPRAPPRAIRGDELGLGQLGARRLEQVLAAPLLVPLVVPRDPATR